MTIIQNHWTFAGFAGPITDNIMQKGNIMEIRSLLTMQRRFMDVLGIHDNDDFRVNELLSSPEFLSAAIGAVSEATEVIDVLNTRARPWLETGSDVRIKQDLVEEIIDVQFYLLELYNILGLTDEDVSAQYIRKLMINMCRFFEKAVSHDRRLELLTEAYKSQDRFMTDEMVRSREQEAALAIVTTVEMLCDGQGVMHHLEKLADAPVTYVRSMFDVSNGL